MEDVFDTITRAITAATNLAACGAAIWFLVVKRPGYPWRVFYVFVVGTSAMFGVFFTWTTISVPTGELLDWFRVWSRLNGTMVGLTFLLAVWFRFRSPGWTRNNET